MEPNEFILPLKVKHFIELEFKPLIGTFTQYYMFGYDCAIEKSLKEYFGIPRVWEHGAHCIVEPVQGNKIGYVHEPYFEGTFFLDLTNAKNNIENPEYIIRELKLKKR